MTTGCFWITVGEASSPSGPWIHADGSTDVLWEQAVAAGTIWPSDWLRPPTEFIRYWACSLLRLCAVVSCIPFKIPVFQHNDQCDSIKKETIKNLLGHEDSSLISEILVLIKDVLLSLWPSCPSALRTHVIVPLWRMQQPDTFFFQSSKQSSGFSSALILDFTASRFT